MTGRRRSVDLPFGGGGAGNRLRRSPSSRGSELERLTGKLVRADPRLHRPVKDIPARISGRMLVHGIMKSIVNTKASTRLVSPASRSSSMRLGGRDAATGYGVAMVTREVPFRGGRRRRRVRRSRSRATATSAATRPIPPQQGGKIVAVSDAYAAVINPEGGPISLCSDKATLQGCRLQRRRKAAPTNSSLLGLLMS